MNKILLLVFVQILPIFGYLDYDSWLNIELHHAVDIQFPEKFTFRGNVTIPSINVGTSNVIQTSLDDLDKKKLKILAEKNQLYRLKAIVSYNDGSKVSYLTSTKACNLGLSNLNDILWISVDSMGFVTAITQTVAFSGNLDCSNTDISMFDLKSFNTDILVKHMELAPLPDTSTFIQKIEKEREARERGEVRDNRGFFAKYWMYIVPGIILIFISGMANPEVQASGGR